MLSEITRNALTDYGPAALLQTNKHTVLRPELLKKAEELASKRSKLRGRAQLSWAVFSDKATTTDANRARITFSKFVSAISKLFGDDEVFVRQAAWAVFQGIVKSFVVSAPSDKNKKKSKAKIEEILGKIDCKDFEELVRLVSELQKWRIASLKEQDVPLVASKEVSEGKALMNRVRTPLLEFLGIQVHALREKLQSCDTRVLVDTIPSSGMDSSSGLLIEPYSTEWLVNKCGTEQIAAAVLSVIHGAASDSSKQDQLLGILGESQIEVVFDVFQHKDMIVSKTQDFVAIPYQGKQSDEVDLSRIQNLMAVPGVTTGITILSEREKEALKKMRKLEKKLLKKGIRTDSSQVKKPVEPKSDDLLESTSFSKSVLSDVPTLPSGTTRFREKEFEIVTVPAPVKAVEEKKIDQESLLDAQSCMSNIGKIVFRGIEKFNVLQSKVFQTAYNSNENMLVCAPTGAGKTNVALLTIVSELNRHIENGVLELDNMKIVYVAPMKALAQEVVEKFQERLKPLGTIVKELTGDVQLSKQEIEKSHVIVTTPEKWDVITRKASGSSSGDGSLVSSVKLLIIDEVHLLHEDRGAVIEVIIARTIRQVEASQSMIRIVGLSATLPNYADVAEFLHVNTATGLFVFDGRYRPVPLEQVFIGVHETNSVKRSNQMNEICARKVTESISQGHQVMIFVHSRRETLRTAQKMIENISQSSFRSAFSALEEESAEGTEEIPSHKDAKKHSKESSFRKRGIVSVKKELAKHYAEVQKSQNKDLKEIFNYRFGVHHAGMVRSDRSLVERMFLNGTIRVLVCTATLAWGVNLPAHTVIIKGTEIYDSKRGGFVDVGILDVMQIFGRAGRPQFDDSGQGIIITSGEKLPMYLNLLTQQLPIESSFIQSLPDNLNAEIVLGTVTNLREALAWLSYTYLYIRMLRNPTAYGIPYEQQIVDPTLLGHRKHLISNAAKALMECRMVRFDTRSGNFFPTDLGRVSSHFYIHHESVLRYNELLHPHMNDEEILHLISISKEFDQIQIRDDELAELDELQKRCCLVPIKGGVEFNFGKTNVLIQAFISRARFNTASLISDSLYISQSVGRISRALFQMAVKKGWPGLAQLLLEFCKMFDRQQWYFQTPLRQIPSMKAELAYKIDERKISLETILDMAPHEVGSLINHVNMGGVVQSLARRIPKLSVEANVKPITQSVLLMKLKLYPEFDWNDHSHGTVQSFILWVEDTENEFIYHTEELLLWKKEYLENDFLEMEWAVPIFEPLPSQYVIRCLSEYWLGGNTSCIVSFRHLVLPEIHARHTPLLHLQPLPISALHNPLYEEFYRKSFTHFNPVQTQMFHIAYHSDSNVLAGAPTGSGKTVLAEVCIFRLLNAHAGKKVIYVAPLKALARQRIQEWRESFGKILGLKIVELTGDNTPDFRALKQADIIITTPEKWDGISRGWRSTSRSYVAQVGLVLIDEIHLLGQERGPILEVIVSRMRYISSTTQNNCRIVGLSTALANANDLAAWLGIEGMSSLS